MTWPTDLATVEIAFGVLPFDDTTLDVPANWTDVSGDTLRGRYQTSKRSSRFSVFSGGTATVWLDNSSRTYDPDHSAGTHFGDFDRNTPIRIIGTHSLGAATFVASTDVWTLTAHGMSNGQRVRFSAAGAAPTQYSSGTDYFVISATTNTFQLSATLGGAAVDGTANSSGTWTLTRLDTQWYGYVKRFAPDYRGLPNFSETAVHAVDALGIMAQYSLAPITEAHYIESTSDRVARVLDDWGFPSSYRSISVGSRNCAGTEFGVNALAHVQQVTLSEGGEFYAQRDGVLTFDGLSALVTDRQATSQDTFGHNGPPTPLNDGSLTRTSTGTGYADKVTINRSGGTAQTTDNSAANEAATVYQKTNLLMESDGQALGLSEYWADLYGTEVNHTDEARYVAKTTDTDVNTILFVRKIRDRVTVEMSPPGGGTDMSDEVFIDGIDGEFGEALWTIRHLYTSADAYDDNLGTAPGNWLVLDTDNLDEERLGY